MIRTSEEILENEQNAVVITAYSSSDVTEEKIFSTEIPKPQSEDFVYKQKAKQLCAL